MKRDVEQTLQILTEVVEAKGEDYSYTDDYPNDTSCTYFTGTADDEYNDGFVKYEEPRCIVGHVFSRIEFLVDVNENFDTPVDGVRGVDLEFNDHAVQVLLRAQQHQDKGKRWGEALEEARKVAAMSAEELAML